MENEPDSEEEGGDAEVKKLEQPRGNILFVAPIKPLPPGEAWRLILEAGIPASEWRTTLPTAMAEAIGTVQLFGVKELRADGNRIAGRRINLEFPKPLAEEVTAETIGRWIKVQPAPPDLKAILEGEGVTLRGAYDLGTTYRVSVAPGLPAREPIVTTAPFQQEVTFEKYESRLYFQDFAAHQYQRGSRELRLLTVNVPRVRVTAKLFTGAAVPIAVKGFDKYEEYDEERPADESYQRVDVEALPGEVIWEKEFAPEGAVDSEETVRLNWDEIVGPNRAGAVLFTAESIDPLTREKRVGTQSLIQLTDIGAAWKRDRDATLFHLFSLATGKAMKGVRVSLLDKDLKQLAQTQTDGRGEALLPKAEEERWLFVESDGDAHLITVYAGENSLPLWHLGVTEESIGEDDEGAFAKTVFLFTERGVYKPGDKLHLKGYAQDSRDEQPRLPGGKSSRSR